MIYAELNFKQYFVSITILDLYMCPLNLKIYLYPFEICLMRPAKLIKSIQTIRNNNIDLEEIFLVNRDKQYCTITLFVNTIDAQIISPPYT